MVKNYLQIETPTLITGKGDKPVTFVIDGVSYTGTVKGAMELMDLQAIPTGTKDVTWVPDATGKNLAGRVTF